MEKTYTINEVAKALNLSRNTVSKVIRQKPGVSKKTHDLVMDYLHQKDMSEPNEKNMNSTSIKGCVVFTYHFENTEYLNNILANIEKTLKTNGYTLLLNIIRDDTLSDIPVPVNLYDGTACGVISFNIFNKHYWNEIIALKIPSVFIETFYDDYFFINKTDIITVESTGPVYNLARRFIEKGKKSFGYVGDKYYCNSTYQRWATLKKALEQSDLTLDDRNCIVDNDEIFHLPDACIYIKEMLLKMPEIPEVFFCSSDLHAILISKALKELNYRIPEDISIVGFDNWTETLRQSPPISTVDAHPDYLGKASAQRLIDRIHNPDLPYELRFCQSDIILRGSTDL